MASPVEQLNQAFKAQVLPGQVRPRDRRPFPPPLGAWLSRGKPRNFRASLRRYKVTPGVLLDHWLFQHSFRFQVDTWPISSIENQFKTWPFSIKSIYGFSRAAFADLISVKGKISDPSRLVCARYGAWRAMTALEVRSMTMSDFSWSDLAVRVTGGILDTGEGYTLVSDNYSGKVIEGVVYTASEMLRLLGVGSTALATVVGVREIFDKAVVWSAKDKPEPEIDTRIPGSIHTWPEKYRKAG